jgi:hypothetical protein
MLRRCIMSPARRKAFIVPVVFAPNNKCARPSPQA